jgi:hypothetical protein
LIKLYREKNKGNCIEGLVSRGASAHKPGEFLEKVQKLRNGNFYTYWGLIADNVRRRALEEISALEGISAKDI